MKFQTLSLLTLALGAAACAQQDQALPFDAPGATTSQTIGAAGGTVSTARGASVQFPSGSVSGATTVTLTTLASPVSTPGATPAGTGSFRLAPEGTALQQPAAVSLKLGAQLPAGQAWLASVLNVTPQGRQEIGAADVDLTAGLVTTSIRTLGTLTAVVPERSAVVRATRLGSARASLAASGAAANAVPTPTTRTLSGSCGDVDHRCDIQFQVSEGLLALADSVALVYPAESGTITVGGTGASGSLTLTGTLRSKIAQVSDGEQITVVATATPATVVTETASEVTLTNVRVTGTGAGMNGEITTTLHVLYSGASASVRIDRNDIRVADQTHSISVSLPLVRS